MKHPERFVERKCLQCGSLYLPNPKVASVQKACSERCGKRLDYAMKRKQRDAKRNEWLVSNRDKQRLYIKTSQLRKPELYREAKRIAENRRRARAAASGGKHSRQEWAELKAKYGYKCLRCGDSEPLVKLNADHIVPLSAGGSDAIDNIQPLCRPCNSWKNHRRVIDFRPVAA